METKYLVSKTAEMYWKNKNKKITAKLYIQTTQSVQFFFKLNIRRGNSVQSSQHSPTLYLQRKIYVRSPENTDNYLETPFGE